MTLRFCICGGIVFYINLEQDSFSLSDKLAERFGRCGGSVERGWVNTFPFIPIFRERYARFPPTGPARSSVAQGQSLYRARRLGSALARAGQFRGAARGAWRGRAAHGRSGAQHAGRSVRGIPGTARHAGRAPPDPTGDPAGRSDRNARSGAYDPHRRCARHHGRRGRGPAAIHRQPKRRHAAGAFVLRLSHGRAGHSRRPHANRGPGGWRNAAPALPVGNQRAPAPDLPHGGRCGVVAAHAKRCWRRVGAYQRLRIQADGCPAAARHDRDQERHGAL